MDVETTFRNPQVGGLLVVKKGRHHKTMKHRDFAQFVSLLEGLLIKTKVERAVLLNVGSLSGPTSFATKLPTLLRVSHFL